MNLNELNTVFTDAGQKVSDLQAKAQAMAINDEVTAEEVADVKNQIDNAIAKRDLAKQNLEQARENQAAEVIKADAKPLSKEETDQKIAFVNDFKDMILDPVKFRNSVNSTTDGSGSQAGLTIPQDIQTQIHFLVRQYDSLEDLVRVEKVGTLSGSRVYEKWVDIKPLTNLDADDATIGANDDPQLTIVKYLIKRYAGITTITNSLLKDTAENILGWLTQWVAHKVMVTRNTAIIEQLDTAPKKATITKFDDVKSLTKQLDPALVATSVFVTNQSGANALANVKTATGKYLMEPDPTQPDQDLINGKPVKVVSDRWLPDVNGVHPFYFGDLQQAVTLFDREDMSIQTTNVGAGSFETDTTKLRVIDRFDVEATDSDAYITASFKKIPDQALVTTTASTATASTTSSTATSTSASN